jgi:PAS domain S-box-containing protein
MDAARRQLILQGLLEQTREYAVIVLDTEGVIRAWLGASEQIFGFSSDEAAGRPAADLFIAADREKGFDQLELSIARAKGHAEDDRWHLRKDGSRVWVSGHLEAVRDAGGALAGFVKVLRDRTDLRLHVDTLEARLAESRQAAERIRSFLRTLGHELRNPLAPLQNAAAIVQRTNSDPRADKAVDIMLAQLQVLNRLADELMEVARLEAGQVRLKLERQDLRKLLAETHEGFRATAAARGLNLVLMVPKGPLWVGLDKPKLQQAVSNLVSNAIKYTPAGGKVWLRATQEGGDVVLRVEDTGVGIPPELLPRLFDLFSRGASATAVEPGGMGLGLAVVRELVELHGGDVQARSSGPGKGSEFTVRLPALDRQGQGAAG